MNRKLVILCGFLLFLSCLATVGYRVHVANHALQLPLVDSLVDKSAYPGDYFVATLDYYGSMLWRVVALLSYAFTLEHVLFVGFLLEKLLLIFAAGRLAYSFYPGSQLAVVGSMAAFSFLINPILGGGQYPQTILNRLVLPSLFSCLPWRCLLNDGRSYGRSCLPSVLI